MTTDDKSLAELPIDEALRIRWGAHGSHQSVNPLEGAHDSLLDTINKLIVASLCNEQFDKVAIDALIDAAYNMRLGIRTQLRNG